MQERTITQTILIYKRNNEPGREPGSVFNCHFRHCEEGAPFDKLGASLPVEAILFHVNEIASGWVSIRARRRFDYAQGVLYSSYSMISPRNDGKQW